MQEPLVVKNEIIINAPAGKVWDALVNPEKTKQYMFGCKTVSDWKPGSELLWTGIWEGKEMVFVKGNIVCIEPNHVLTYTVFDPNNTTIQDLPGNYLQITYLLEEENGETKLTVTQGDFNTLEDGERRYQEAFNEGEGWNPILDAIKKMVETCE